MADDLTYKYSIDEYPADGVQTQFEISFSGGYLNREHVLANYTDSAGVLSSVEFTWVDDFTVNVDPAPAAGGTIRFFRRTPRDLPLVDFADGAVINETALDINAKQAVFLAAETIDSFGLLVDPGVAESFISALSYAVDRQNHTGMQSTDTITGLTATLLALTNGLAALQGYPYTVASFEGLAAATISSALTTVRVSGRGQPTMQEVPFSTALPTSGQGIWWTTSNSGTRKWVIVSELNSEAFGAARDGTTDDVAILKELIEVAGPYFGKPVYLSKGKHKLVVDSAAKSIMVPAGQLVQFKYGASVSWGQTNLYYPPFVVKQNNVSLIDFNMEFTGTLTYGSGTGYDFVGPNDDSGDATFDKLDVAPGRYGTANDNRTRSYASGIFIVECSNTTVTGFVGRGLSNTTFIHSWVGANRNDNLHFYNNTFNDCCLGIVTTGGQGNHEFYRTKGDRLNQDFGIPGHLIYTYCHGNVIIDGVEDLGTETGTRTDRVSSHSVSYAGTGRAVITNVTSNRAAGPISYRNTPNGVAISNVVWTFPEGETRPYWNSYGALRAIDTSDTLKNCVISNVTLDGGKSDMPMLSGNCEHVVASNVILKRDSSAGQTRPWMNIKSGFGGNQGGHDITATLVETSGTAVSMIQDVDSQLANSVFNLHLWGWGNRTPTFGITLTINTEFRLTFDSTHAGWVGSPTEVFPGSDDFRRASNRLIVVAANSAPWTFQNAAATSVTNRVPMREGMNEVSVSIRDATVAGFYRTQVFRVWASRAGAAPVATGSFQIGTDYGSNTTVFGTTVLAPVTSGYLDITIPITDATIQTRATTTYISTRYLGKY